MPGSSVWQAFGRDMDLFCHTRMSSPASPHPAKLFVSIYRQWKLELLIYIKQFPASNEEKYINLYLKKNGISLTNYFILLTLKALSFFL